MHPGADRRKSSIPVRTHTLRVLSGKQLLFSRVEPRMPSSLYGDEGIYFLRSNYGTGQLYQGRDSSDPGA